VLGESQVARVERRDSLINGTRYGVAGGFVALDVAPRDICSPNDPGCDAIVTVVIGMPAIGIGALIGALTDSAWRATIFETPRSKALASVSIAPIVSRRQRGVALTVGW
jgi:hypothetical protein